MAVAQCRNFLREQLPDAQIQAATSTAEAARQVGEQRLEGVATISNPLAAELYGLEAVAEAVEDHTGNQTRFLLLAREGVPAPTGHDKTSVVVFQRANEPGSLLAILHEFAARNIDLSRLESRPTRRVLGDYCFLLDFDGHIGDEVVADCLRDLKMKQGDIKFLGSYPAAANWSVRNGGGCGIRTHGDREATLVFKTSSLNQTRTTLRTRRYRSDMADPHI